MEAGPAGGPGHGAGQVGLAVLVGDGLRHRREREGAEHERGGQWTQKGIDEHGLLDLRFYCKSVVFGGPGRFRSRDGETRFCRTTGKRRSQA